MISERILNTQVRARLSMTAGILLIFLTSNTFALTPASDSKISPALEPGSLKQLLGTVLVNHGKGYSMAKLNIDIQKGDRVLTMDNASVVVILGNGCVIRLKENSIFTHDGKDNCSENMKSVKKVGPYYARAIGSEAITDVPVDAGNKDPVGRDGENLKGKSDGDNEAFIPEGGSEVATATDGASTTTASSGSFLDGFSTAQIVTTGVAVGLGIAVISSSDDDPVSGQ